MACNCLDSALHSDESVNDRGGALSQAAYIAPEGAIALEDAGVSPSTENRIDKIRDWLLWQEARYAETLSNPTHEERGWDNRPSVQPCECRPAWRHEKLCMCCDNTGYRRTWPGEEGIDPYALEVKAVKGGWTAQSAGDESVAQKRAASIAQLDAALARLAHDVLLREGKEAQADKAMRQYITVTQVPHQMRVIQRGVARLRAADPELAARLPWDREALLELAIIVPGRIHAAP